MNLISKRIAAAAGILSLLLTPAAAEESERYVVPGGQSVGVSLNMGGAYVDKPGDVETADGNTVSPARDAGIEPGDTITAVNGAAVGTVDEFTKKLNRLSDGEEAHLTVENGNGSREVGVVPVRAADGRLKIGVWIIDAASGVGTVTYYDPKTKKFAAVGHSISESAENEDGGHVGDVYKADIAGVRRGENGAPGELIGVYSENRRKIGEIERSSRYGITGTVTDPENLVSVSEAVPVGSREEIHKGEARIYSNIEGSRIEDFSIEITEINYDSGEDKDIIFKVTDDELIKKTGGIVRGMSGSPIIQDGKLIGSVTHVLVKEPEVGYGIFIESIPE